jgi:hypothetical protein
VAKSTVVDRDKGFKALMRMTERMKAEKPYVVVGITGKSGGKPHEDAEGMTIVDIGAVHEFGIPGKIPERSFIRATVDEHGKKYRKYIVDGVRREAMEAAKAATFSTSSQTLKRTGLMVEGDIKKRIAAGIAPPNAPATIARKGSSKPLINTGQLRASIASELRKGRGP